MFWVGAKFHLRTAHKWLRRSIHRTKIQTAPTLLTTMTQKCGGAMMRPAKVVN